MEALTQEAAGQLLHIFLLGIGSTPKEAKIGLDTKILLGYNWAKKKISRHPWLGGTEGINWKKNS